MKQILRVIGVLLFIAMVSLFFSGRSYACVNTQDTCSADYGIGRYSIDSGGNLDTTCSASYCAAQTLGDTGIGNTSSASYQAQAGFNVNREPSLELYVSSSNVPLGVQSTASTSYGTASFSVESYLSSGYVVQTVSPGLQYGTYTISNMTPPAASAVGTEQFGMNLVSNSTSCTPAAPANFGANPVQVPSSSYSYGQAAGAAYNPGDGDYYNVCGDFAYQNGDTIAYSTSSSGETNYTISYIFNIKTLTPAGQYTMNQQLVAEPTF